MPFLLITPKYFAFLLFPEICILQCSTFPVFRRDCSRLSQQGICEKSSEENNLKDHFLSSPRESTWLAQFQMPKRAYSLHTMDALGASRLHFSLEILTEKSWDFFRLLRPLTKISLTENDLTADTSERKPKPPNYLNFLPQNPQTHFI